MSIKKLKTHIKEMRSTSVVSRGRHLDDKTIKNYEGMIIRKVRTVTTFQEGKTIVIGTAVAGKAPLLDMNGVFKGICFITIH